LNPGEAPPGTLPADDAVRGAATKVSVLMPMRNPGRFALPAVRSVLDQDHPNLELIVIDDGSTDGSRELIESLRDPRVRLVDGPRAGISACLNVGLAHVTGELIMRCDADDLYPPGRIRAQVEWLHRRPDFIAVCSAFSMISPDGTPVASPMRQATQDLADGSDRILDGRLKTHLCTFAFRSEVVARVGNFRAFFETAEDIDFALRLAEAGAIGFSARDGYLYRLHDASITHTQAALRRRFFETTAYAMSRDRQATGTDALMRGEPIEVPATGQGGHRPDGAGLHMAQLLVGESWRAFMLGHRPEARRQALRAIVACPTHRDAWKALLLVSIKPVPRSVP
jgi:glycosyltransferase involved in cell wall biosynthesis